MHKKLLKYIDLESNEIKKRKIEPQLEKCTDIEKAIKIVEKEGILLSPKLYAMIIENESKQASNDSDDITTMTVKQLKEIAKDLNIEDYKKMTKADLLKAIEQTKE